MLQSFPYNLYPKLMVIAFVKCDVKWINAFKIENVISST